MKKFAKGAVALFMAAVLCMSLGACYDEDLTWAAKKGDLELPIGAYIYYLSISYNEAAAQIGTDTKVLDGEVEGTPAEEWIVAKAQQYVNQFYWMDDEMQRLGLTLTEDDLNSATTTSSSYWAYYGATFESYGIAQSSFNTAYALYNAKYARVFEALYGAGGEREIPAEDIEAHFLDTYYNYEFYTVPMTTTDDEGNSVDMTDEEKAALTKELEAVAGEIRAGDTTVMDAANDSAEALESDSTFSSNVQTRDDMESAFLPTAFVDTLTTMDEGDVEVFEASSRMVVLHRLPTADRLEEATGSDDNLLSLMLEIKNEEFSEFVEESAASVEGVEMNTRATSRYKPSMFAATTENGTSSVASEDESSASESSEESESSGE